MQQKKLELLAPAGDWERLEMALAYGADAVYLAGNTFGMRSFAGNFSPEELRRAAKLCRERGVDLHVTCNTMPRNDEMARLPQWLELLEEAGVTAVILADVGVPGFGQALRPLRARSTSAPRPASSITRRPRPGMTWGRTG